MISPRKIARALLEGAVRMAPPHTAEWAQAMLSELDYVEGEWSALIWALGSAAAVVRRSARDWRGWFRQSESNGRQPMNANGKKAIGIVSGALSALALAGCAFALLRLVDRLFPALGIARTEWTHWFGAIVIPEAIFIVAAVLLWRRRGPIAAGILLVAVAIALHVLVHVAAH